MDINLQQYCDNESVENLLDTCFGKDRHKKAAYGLRDGVDAITNLSFTMKSEDVVIGTLRFWSVVVDGVDALLLGPIAVSPKLQGQGYGITLMRHGLECAKQLGHERVILVGDEAYYNKVGFCRELVLNITIEGQVDESRILGLELRTGAFNDINGRLEKRTT